MQDILEAYPETHDKINLLKYHIEVCEQKVNNQLEKLRNEKKRKKNNKARLNLMKNK
jgi:hypothetical protein